MRRIPCRIAPVLAHRIVLYAPDFILTEAANVIWKKAQRREMTDCAIQAERRILEMMRAGRGQGRTFVHAASIEARLARAPDWLIGVQGHAGAGKTTMLSAAAQLPGMPRMHGLVLSSAAVRTLAREAGIENSAPGSPTRAHGIGRVTQSKHSPENPARFSAQLYLAIRHRRATRGRRHAACGERSARAESSLPDCPSHPRS